MKKYLPLVLATLIAPSANAVIIVNDSFADGNRLVTGPLQADFYASSSSNAIESNFGSVGLVSGSSGRQIHALFATQTLANAGDTMTASITFVTPNTVGASTEDLKIGLFDHLNRTSAAELGQDNSYSTSSPNPLFSGLPGFYSEIDVESADSATDFDVRVSDPSNTGRLLATSTGFTAIGSGPDVGYTIVANTTYTFTLILARDALGGIDVTSQLGANSYTHNIAAPGSYSFGMLAIGASTNAFGSSSTPGDPDNGIDITNFTLDFTPVPEPSSMLLVLGGSCLLLRRRRSMA
jgi:hypothetical protein